MDGVKREHDGADHAAGVRPAKKAKPTVVAGKELLPAPYFYYRDHSTEQDPDPLTPLTPPGRVPNFPAKMHAILSRKDFEDIVAWLPHGRSWRVLKPREFEVKVIPKFFEHAKFSSFVRQANGWGFRRITQGKDRNSYYHEMFLRGLPHLCKTMKRPGVAEKKAADPDHEPDLYKISEEHPVPQKAEDDSVLLHSTLEGGPKARMPIYWGSTMTPAGMAPSIVHQPPVATSAMAPNDQVAFQGFQQSMAASEKQVVQKPASPMSISPTASPPTVAKPMAMPSFLAVPSATGPSAPLQLTPQPANGFAALAAANQMAFQMPQMPGMGMNAAATAQFAAGFAAATAFSQQHFSNVLGSLAAQQSKAAQYHMAPQQHMMHKQASPMHQYQKPALQPQAMPQQKS